MRNVWSFAQRKVEADARRLLSLGGDTEGVCFRLAFKWLACMIYDKDFNPESKPQSTFNKQQAYLATAAPFEGKKAFGSYFVNMNALNKRQLNAWGHKDGKNAQAKYRLSFQDHVVYNTLNGCSAFNEDGSMVIGLYGTVVRNMPWSHAVAFHRAGDQVLYFDPNAGVYELGAGEAVGQAIMDQLLAWRYFGRDDEGKLYTLERIVLYKALKA